MRILHPRPELGRQKAFGVEFRDGVALVESLHPERELALRQHGYTIEVEFAEPEVDDETFISPRRGRRRTAALPPMVEGEQAERDAPGDGVPREGIELPADGVERDADLSDSEE